MPLGQDMGHVHQWTKLSFVTFTQQWTAIRPFAFTCNEDLAPVLTFDYVVFKTAWIEAVFTVCSFLNRLLQLNFQIAQDFIFWLKIISFNYSRYTIHQENYTERKFKVKKLSMLWGANVLFEFQLNHVTFLQLKQLIQ